MRSTFQWLDQSDMIGRTTALLSRGVIRESKGRFFLCLAYDLIGGCMLG
jgi:hypothetical protein